MGHPADTAKIIIKEVPQGKLVVVPGAAHIQHIEQAAVFRAAVLSFLKERVHKRTNGVFLLVEPRPSLESVHGLVCGRGIVSTP